MTELQRSVRRTLADGTERGWPSVTDYADYYVAEGLIADRVGIDDSHDLILSIYRDWVLRGQTSCQFASSLAAKPEQSIWNYLTFPPGVHGRPDLGVAVTDFIESAPFGHSELWALIFPYVKDEATLVKTLAALMTGDSGWYWTEVMDAESADPDHFCLGLRWVLPDESHVSWTLGFAPFDFLPFTRRGPFAAIFLRASSDKRTADLPDANGRTPVHLADMEDFLPSEEARARVGINTAAQKANILKDELRWAARAKVTFRLPNELKRFLPASLPV